MCDRRRKFSCVAYVRSAEKLNLKLAELLFRLLPIADVNANAMPTDDVPRISFTGPALI
jgi:hypothetical protein